MQLHLFFSNLTGALVPEGRIRGMDYYFCPPDLMNTGKKPEIAQVIGLVMNRVGRDAFALYPAYSVWLRVSTCKFLNPENPSYGEYDIGKPVWYLVSKCMSNVEAHSILDRWNKDPEAALDFLAAHMPRRDHVALDRFFQHRLTFK